jgi:cell division GTPase FtsZ
MGRTAIPAAGILDASADSRQVMTAASFAAIKALLDIDDLEGAVSAIQELLASDDTDLDSFQEFVDQVKAILDGTGLAIASVPGLQAALDSKDASLSIHANEIQHGTTLTEQTQIEQAATHLTDNANPHNTTVTQTGGYTREEVDALIAASGGRSFRGGSFV